LVAVLAAVATLVVEVREAVGKILSLSRKTEWLRL